MPLVIRSRREGFRRCGIAHSVAPTTYPDNKFDASQLDALRCEPMLIVEETVVGEATNPTPENTLETRGVLLIPPSENSDAEVAPVAGEVPNPTPEIILEAPSDSLTPASENAEVVKEKSSAKPAKTTKAK